MLDMVRYAAPAVWIKVKHHSKHPAVCLCSISRSRRTTYHYVHNHKHKECGQTILTWTITHELSLPPRLAYVHGSVPMHQIDINDDDNRNRYTVVASLLWDVTLIKITSSVKI